MTTFFSRLPICFSVIAGLLLITLSCKKNDDTVASPQTITDRVLEDPQFSFLRVAVAYASVGDALKSGNLTLFAPTDSAFQALGLASPATILSMPKEQVRNMVLYHVLSGPVQASAIPSGQNAVEMVSKGLAYVNHASNGTVYINNAQIVEPDLMVANGYIHRIDRVLMPATGTLLTTIQNNSNLTFLSAAINRIGTSNPALLTALNGSSSAGNVTVFAPNDDAFKANGKYTTLAAIESADAQTLANTLLYHVTSGILFSRQLQTGSLTSLLSGNKFMVTTTAGQTTIKGNKNTTAAVIKQADVATNNGVIHVIDQVLQP